MILCIIGLVVWGMLQRYGYANYAMTRLLMFVNLYLHFQTWSGDFHRGGDMVCLLNTGLTWVQFQPRYKIYAQLFILFYYYHLRFCSQ